MVQYGDDGVSLINDFNNHKVILLAPVVAHVKVIIENVFEHLSKASLESVDGEFVDSNQTKSIVVRMTSNCH